MFPGSDGAFPAQTEEYRLGTGKSRNMSIMPCSGLCPSSSSPVLHSQWLHCWQRGHCSSGALHPSAAAGWMPGQADDGLFVPLCGSAGRDLVQIISCCRTVPCSEFPGLVFSLQLNPTAVPRLQLWMTVAEESALCPGCRSSGQRCFVSAISAPAPAGGSALPAAPLQPSLGCSAQSIPAWAIGRVWEIPFEGPMELGCVWGACCKQLFAGTNPACIVDTALMCFLLNKDKHHRVLFNELLQGMKPALGSAAGLRLCLGCAP